MDRTIKKGLPPAKNMRQALQLCADAGPLQRPFLWAPLEAFQKVEDAGKAIPSMLFSDRRPTMLQPKFLSWLKSELISAAKGKRNDCRRAPLRRILQPR